MKPVAHNSAQRRGLITAKALYFLIFAAIGALFPFLNLYYYDIGLSGTQIGLVNTLSPLVGAFSAVIWGMINDRIGRIRLLLSIATLGVIGVVLALSQAVTFWWILPNAALVSLFGSPMNSLLDSTTLRLLGERSAEYGRQRLWGAFGFILTSSLTGIILERAGKGWMFYIYAGCMVFFILTVQFLPAQPPGYLGVSLWRGVSGMVRRPAWLLFAASVALCWFSVTGGFIFIGVTMRTLGGGNELVGLASTFSAVAEIPVMFKGSSFLRRFGAGRLVGFSMLMYGLREALYAGMLAPTWALGINLMQAVTYVPFWLGSVAYASELAPDELKSTSQGLLFMVMNLANVLGSLVSGLLFDQFGARGLYSVLAAACLAAFALFSFGQARMRRQERLAAGEG